MSLTISDLSPELQIELDVFQAEHPQLDLSEYRLREYGNTVRGEGQYILGAPLCEQSGSHRSERCRCVTNVDVDDRGYDQWVAYVGGWLK